MSAPTVTRRGPDALRSASPPFDPINPEKICHLAGKGYILKFYDIHIPAIAKEFFMGGYFGVVSNRECTVDLFYGTDYHSHLGNQRGGLVVHDGNTFNRCIHDITHDQFRSKFEHDLDYLNGTMGIGIISDYDDQPLIITGRHGRFSLVMVGLINNLHELTEQALSNGNIHFAEVADKEISPTEMVASLICSQPTLAEGIRFAQEQIDGSCSLLLLTDSGVYAARDRYGRTPIVIGEKAVRNEAGQLIGKAYAAAFESCSLHNLEYCVTRWLGPNEVVKIQRITYTAADFDDDGTLKTTAFRQNFLHDVLPPGKTMKICTFLWVYYGFPASSYENINAEMVRYRCGEALAVRDHDIQVDAVAGIPDSGTAHALGYAMKARIPYRRSFVKYTPTWARSFISNAQKIRLHVARMKLIPITEFIRGQRLLFCEDSIVRGTQLKRTFSRLPEWGVEVHVRAACPPILFCCKYLNFSPCENPGELAARRAVLRLEGEINAKLDRYADPDAPEHLAMIESIRQEMNFTTLRFQTLPDLIKAVGLPPENLCTYCWNGKE